MCVTNKETKNLMKKIGVIMNKIPWTLILAKLSHTITDFDNRLLEEWLQNDLHKEIYLSVVHVWHSVQSKVRDYEPDEDYYWTFISNRINKVENKKKVRHLLMNRIVRVGIAASLLLIIGFSLLIGLEPIKNNNIQLPVYSSLEGKTKIVLTDSTVVWLRKNSTLICLSDFFGKERRVKLNGAAFFEVKSDKNHPFIVEARDLNVKVHGTKFVVSASQFQEDVVVGLEEGSVELISPTVKSQFLNPGEVAEYNKKNAQLNVKKEDTAIYNSWMADEIFFNGNTLEYICKILSFRFDKNIKVDPSIGTRYRYMLHLHDETLDELLDMLISINPIQYEYVDSNSIFISNQ